MALFGDKHPRYVAFIDADDRKYAANATEESPARVVVACPAGHTNRVPFATLTRRAREGKYPCPDCEWRLLFTHFPWVRKFYRGQVPESWIVETSEEPVPWEDDEGRWNESPSSLSHRLMYVRKGARSLGRPEAAQDSETAPVMVRPVFASVFRPAFGPVTLPTAKTDAAKTDAEKLAQAWQESRELRAEVMDYRSRAARQGTAELEAARELTAQASRVQRRAAELGDDTLDSFARKTQRLVDTLHVGESPVAALVNESRAVRAEVARLHALPNTEVDPTAVQGLLERAEELRASVRDAGSRKKNSDAAKYAKATVRRARALLRKVDAGSSHVEEARHARRLERLSGARSGRRWLGSQLPTGGSVGSTLEAAVLKQLGTEVADGLALNTTAVIPPMELDMFAPGVGAAIEVNGEQHHAAPRVGELYHRRKWELCRAAGVDLYGLWSGRWNANPEAVLHEARRALRVCPVYPGGTGAPERVAHSQAREFLSGHSTQSPMPGLRYVGVRDARGSLLALAGYRVRSGAATVFRSATVGYVPGSTGSLLQHIAAEASSVRWRVDNLAGYLRELEASGMVLLDDGAARRSPEFSREVWDAGASVFELR